MKDKLFRSCISEIKPYSPGKPISEVERELGIKNAIKLASNENLLGPSPLAIKKIKEKVNEINYYPDSGCFYLKRELAKKIGVTPENLIIGCGADELIHHLMLIFINAGDEIIAPYPSFVMYEIATKIMDGKIIKVELSNFKHDLDKMKEKINSKTKLIFICSPNNPTGTIVEKEELEKFMLDVPEDVVVVFDEAYREFVESKSYPQTTDLLKEKSNVVILRTFSKIYGLAGLRIGYGITSKEISENVDKVRGPFNVNSLAQEAVLAALGDNEHIIKSQKMVWEGKKYLYKNLGKMGIEYVPTESNFILINTGRKASEVFQKLLFEGVIVRSGEVLGYQNHIRVTIGREADNKKFIQALKKVIKNKKGETSNN